MLDPRIDRAIAAALAVRSAHFQPIFRDGRSLGVLVVYWRTLRCALEDRTRTMLELFANEAATVIEHADLITRLENQARTDALTGVANRRALEETLVRELAAAERQRRPVAIVMLDMDHFKAYNDRYGHPAGDAMLAGTAAAWRAELRPTDTLARYGGEEFLAVLPATDVDGAVKTADRLRRVTPDGQTASAGAAVWDGRESPSELIDRADAALYEAKQGGRNRTVAAAASGGGVASAAAEAGRPTRRRRARRAAA
jgi:diguanylate cyclase (GGDEF)-like protein